MRTWRAAWPSAGPLAFAAAVAVALGVELGLDADRVLPADHVPIDHGDPVDPADPSTQSGPSTLPIRARWPAVPDAVLAAAFGGGGGPAAALGPIYELTRERPERRRRGAVFTPYPLAAALVATTEAREGHLQVLDPAAGGGVFLLAAADRAVALGADPDAVVRSLHGRDVDGGAVTLARAALVLWLAGIAGPAAVTPSLTAELRAHVRVGDPLRGPASIGDDGPEVDLVVGNPPFLGQLKRETARSREEAAALAARFGVAAGPYTDTAGYFLLAGLRAVRPGGTVLLVVPESILVARDAAPIRDAVLAGADLVGVWRAGVDVFPAGVRAVSVQLRRHGPEHEPGAPAAPSTGTVIRRWTGPAVVPTTPVDGEVAPAVRAGGPWGPLVADLAGVPAIDPAWASETTRVLGSIATATAGFRDEYYLVADHVREADGGDGAAEDVAPHSGPGGTDPEEPVVSADRQGPGRRTPGARVRLVTVGAIDPVHLRWGRVPIRYRRQAWNAPVVDVDGIDPDSALGRWSRDRLRPKVVVATQSPVLEVVVDHDGSLWPSTPVVAVVPSGDGGAGHPGSPGRAGTDLVMLAAAISAPHATAWAATRYGGAGLSATAVKLSARQLLTLPLPTDADRWQAAASALGQAEAAASAGDGAAWRDELRRFAEVMVEAYPGTTADRAVVLEWWWARVPPWRGPSTESA